MDRPIAVNPGYVLGQLARALQTRDHHEDAGARERAAKKIERWQCVIEGMSGGTLTVGSRTPVAGVPAWATLEVAHGGFATGRLLAGGPLEPHEVELGARIGASGGERAALNLHYLGDAGRAELGRMLASGCYRVNVPEEGALLVVTWLVTRGHVERAAEVIDAIIGFADRLRFYPVPDERPLVQGAFVKLRTAAETADDLEARRPRDQIARMNEALAVWAPLYDRAVALFLETVDGAVPTLRKDASGALVRRDDGHPYIDGGWPCKRYPAGWTERARALLDDYRQTRAHHRLCGKPDRAKENFAILRGSLECCLQDPAALTGRDVGAIRRVLASFVARHGAPGSPEHASLRAEQARIAARPTHDRLARLLASRLRALPSDAGLETPDAVAGPVSEGESAALRIPAGVAMPASLVKKLHRCVEAPIAELVDRGVIGSSEVIARVLPQITAQVRAAGIEDPDLSRLYGAVYAAFRRRRSLLLLDLEHQVKLEELPWIAAIDGFRQTDLGASERARQTLEQVATLAITSFPETILPNKLLQEMRALVSDAGLRIPLVDELAADIFMGEFSAKFLDAARIAARTLRGTLYARYYDVPCDRVLAIDDVQTKLAAPSSPAFAALCAELAGRDDAAQPTAWSVANSGRTIEQEQILTTHNLAALFESLRLSEALRGRLPDLARRCFRWICAVSQIQSGAWPVKLRRVKNCAYAWRQMIFFLSFVDRPSLEAFLAWASDHLGEQRPDFQRRFQPAMQGLAHVAGGAAFDATGRCDEGRRFLGWSVGAHWLIAERG